MIVALINTILSFKGIEIVKLLPEYSASEPPSGAEEAADAALTRNLCSQMGIWEEKEEETWDGPHFEAPSEFSRTSDFRL